MGIILHWLIVTVAIMISAYLLPGVKVAGFFPALVAAVVLGLLNTLLKPILVFLTLPINILTLGLFTLVINAAIIMLATKLVPGFTVASWGWAILFSIVLSLVGMVFRS